jgi:hypothetical protein
MRPYLLMIAVVLMAAAAFGQQPYPYDALCFSLRRKFLWDKLLRTRWARPTLQPV